MDNTHPNLIIASYLYRLSALTSAIAYFILKPSLAMLEEFLTLIIIIAVAHLIRKGYKWVKWTLLVMEIIYLPFYIITLFTIKFSVTIDMVGAVINLMQLAALVFIFIPSRVSPDL